MAFLTQLLSGLAVAILDWIHGKVSRLLSRILYWKRTRERIHQKNKDIREKTQNASTPSEREDAARTDINNF